MADRKPSKNIVVRRQAPASPQPQALRAGTVKIPVSRESELQNACSQSELVKRCKDKGDGKRVAWLLYLALRADDALTNKPASNVDELWKKIFETTAKFDHLVHSIETEIQADASRPFFVQMPTGKTVVPRQLDFVEQRKVISVLRKGLEDKWSLYRVMIGESTVPEALSRATGSRRIKYYGKVDDGTPKGMTTDRAMKEKVWEYISTLQYIRRLPQFSI